MIKNKKSNIPIIFFVLGVFLICSFALLTFFVSDFELGNSFVGISVLRSTSYDLDEYNFYVNQGVLQEKIESYFDIRKDNQGKYLYEEKQWRGKVVFSVKVYLP